MNLKNSHLFAFFSKELKQINISGKTLIIDDEDLTTRLNKILRFTPKDQCIVFNQNHHIHLNYKEKISKKSTIFNIIDSIKPNLPSNPYIHLFCPILKKNTFEEVFDDLGEIGVSEITPVITKKSSRKYLDQKEIDKLTKHLISGCELSKNFCVPIINETIDFQMIKSKKLYYNIYLDINGDNNLFQIMEKISKESSKENCKIQILLGPEGDLDESEYQKLSEWSRLKLSNTTLKSKNALRIAIGSLKSIFV